MIHKRISMMSITVRADPSRVMRLFVLEMYRELVKYNCESLLVKYDQIYSIFTYSTDFG